MFDESALTPDTDNAVEFLLSAMVHACEPDAMSSATEIQNLALKLPSTTTLTEINTLLSRIEATHGLRIV